MSPTRPKQPLKYFSLFSGIGGFELGIQTAFAKRHSTINQGDEHQVQSESDIRGGYGSTKTTQSTPSVEGLEKCQSGVVRPRSKPNSDDRQTPICLGFSEIDKYATQVYKNHFNHKEYGNVSAIDWSDTEYFDLLVGGFPCQAFSIAGKRQGFCDTRGTLFFEAARCLREKQPRLFLLENVKGLLSHDKGKTFGVILNTLDELGYDLQWQVLNSKNFGVPQNRERVFIVGHLRGTRRPEVFPIREGSGNFVSGDSKTTKQFANTITAKYGTGNARGTHLMIRDGRDNRSCLRSGRVLKLGVPGSSIRRLTPVECERLQGFPNGWTEGISNTQRYKCLGNAVTVNVIEAIITRLLETL